MERKPKTIFQLESPYSEVKWPPVSLSDQETILELLTSLLSPVGQYRTTHVSPSRGKRTKKRKRHEARVSDSKTVAKSDENQVPPPPEIASYVAVGSANVLRLLQSSSQRTTLGSNAKSDTTQQRNVEAHPLLAVFSCRSSQPAMLHSHLPQLVGTASLASRSMNPIRLVQLPKGCEERLCNSLGLPRAGIVALIAGAPHSKPLKDFLYEYVPAVEMTWMEQMEDGQYQALKVNAIETSAPVAQKRSLKTG